MRPEGSLFQDGHVKRYKKRPIYWVITSPKGTMQALIYLRLYQQKSEAKRVSAEHVLTGGGSSHSENGTPIIR